MSVLARFCACFMGQLMTPRKMMCLLLALIAFAAASPQAHAQEPLALYRADGSAEDASGNANHGAPLGDPAYAPGLSGQAFEFDGRGQSVKTGIDTHPANSPSMTWSAWILPRKIGAKRQILSSDNGDYKRSLLLLENRFAVFTGGSLWETSEIAEPGVWQHVAVVFDGTEVRFYKNGNENHFANNVTSSAPVAPLCIGRNPAFGEHFGGLTDEVGIYDRALSADEIAAIYEKLRAKAEAAPAEDISNSLDPENGCPPTENVAETRIAAKEQGAPTAPQPPPIRAATALAATTKPEQQPPHTTPPQPSTIAMRAVTEKWAEPQTFADKPDAWKIEGHRNAGKKERSSDYLGSATLLLFLDGGGVLSPILPAAGRLQSEGLKVVVLTPGRPAKPERGKKEASLEAGLRALVPAIPEGAEILADPYGSVRYGLGLFGAPAVLFDKKGRIVWKTRIGLRETLDNPEEFELVARLALEDQIKQAPKPIRSLSGKPEKEVFGFENGWEGWEISGNAWNPPGETTQGPSGERHLPGLVAGFLGRGWISSFAGDCSRGTGVATSPEFVLDAPYLHFLAGGGDIAQNAGVALEVDGKFVRSFTPAETTYELGPACWDVSGYAGKKARIVVYDAGDKEQRDGIMADAFTLSASPETPKTFAGRHDPNDPTHIARVARDYPETWRRLLAGDFYQKPTGQTVFEIERVADVKARPNTGRNLAFTHIAISEKTPIQEASDQKVAIEVDGVAGSSKNLELKDTVYAKEVLAAENNRVPRKSLQVRISARVAIAGRELRMGKNPDYRPPSTKEIAANAGLPVTPEALALFKKEKILRTPQETDRAYILRVWRYMQRYYTNWAEWGGWPTPKEMRANATIPFGGLDEKEWEKFRDQTSGLEILAPVWGEWLATKSISCPAAGLFAILSQLAKIPTQAGQGFWANKEIGGKSVPHVRALVFLEGAGWLLLDDDKYVTSPYGQFSEGTRTGDNYFQYVDEKVSYPSNANLEFLDPFVTWKTKTVAETTGYGDKNGKTTP